MSGKNTRARIVGLLLGIGMVFLFTGSRVWADTFLYFPLDSDPGWATEGLWEFGPPQGIGSDPDSANTGTNVYGYNLAGDYTNSMPQYWLTTAPLDCTEYINVQLSFYRWLGVESASWDSATIQVSHDGLTWTNVWEHDNGEIHDTSWQKFSYSISAVADAQPTVFVRWSMGPTDSVVTDAGWSIDDITLSGDLVDHLEISPAEEWVASGHTGGPFGPDTMQYSLTNNGAPPLDWLLSEPADWFSASLSNGTLNGGATTNVILSINPSATNLSAGIYQEPIIFSNITSTTHHTYTGSLHIAAEHLTVNPNDDCSSWGYVGGPFSPVDTIYSLTNNGIDDLDWTANATASWFDVTPYGAPLPGGTSTNVTLSITPAATNLLQGTYFADVVFSNQLSSEVYSRGITLQVDPIPGEISVQDSIAPTYDLTMPFGEIISGFSSTGQVTILNTNSTYDLILSDISFNFYQENFDDGLAQEWVQDISTNWMVIGQEYRAYKSSVDFMMANYAGEEWEDVSAQMSCHRDGAIFNSASLILRASPDFDSGTGSGYVFQLALTGRYSIWKQVDGEFSWVQYWTTSPAIQPGTNVLMATASGSTLQIYINGEFVWSGTDTSLTNGRIGLAGYNLGECIHYFDNVVAEGPTLSAQQISSEQAWFNANPSEGGSKERAPEETTPQVYQSTINEEDSEEALLIDITDTPFSLTNLPPFPHAISPGGALVFDVLFVPHSIGEERIEVSIQSNDDDEPEVLLSLSGTGIYDYLQISPDQGFESSGHPGGPFSPAFMEYALTNNSTAPIVWTADTSDSWASITPSGGTLPPGSISNATVEFTTAAELLMEGEHTATLIFSNQTTGITHTRDIGLDLFTTPEIHISPEEGFVVTNVSGTIQMRSLIVSNSAAADGNLDFTASTRPLLSTPLSPETARVASALIPIQQKHDFTEVAQDIDYKPERLLVKFANGRRHADHERTASKLGGRIVRRYDLVPGLCLVELRGGRQRSSKKSLVAQKLAPFNTDADVIYAQPDYVWHADNIPNDTRFDELWGMHNTGQTGGTPDADIDAPEAWSLPRGTNGVIVAVIDSGVDYTHPDLNDNMWVNVAEIPGNGLDDDGNGYVDDIHGYDFVNDDGDPMDDNFHGTHCAGILGAESGNAEGVTGTSPDIKIMALKFLNAGGNGTTADAISSVEYATVMGAKVMNNSWGGGGYNQALRDVIEAAGAMNIPFVAAAGNDGTDNDSSPHYPSSYVSDNIISVINSDHNDAKSGSSNYGLTSTDLAAPGDNILSCWPGGDYNVISGTSMATPHVAGACALMYSITPSLTPQEIKKVLMETVDPTLPGTCASGGRLNLASAVAAISVPWLSVTPHGANDLIPGSSTNLSVYFDATDFAPGSYSGEVIVVSNDPIAPRTAIPATMLVIPEPLGITPISDWNPNGYEGGELAPTSMIYTLTNSADLSINWSAHETAAWFDAFPSNGTLAAGATTNLTVSLNDSATNLTAGTYAEQILFSNLTYATEQVRQSTLEIAPEPLSITPLLGWSSYGYEGGPFSPDSMTYMLTNSALTNMEWSVSENATWLNATPENGIIGAGASTNLTFTILPSSAGLTPGIYQEQVLFSNLTAGTLQTRSAILEISPEPLVIDPAGDWTSSGHKGGVFAPSTMVYSLTNSTSTPLEWAAIETASWFDSAQTNGVLEAGTTTNVVLSINDSVTNLSPGVYADTIAFTNLTAGRQQSRSATLEIFPETLGINPLDEWNPAGLEGGPFTTTVKTYTLTNNSTVSLAWAATETALWFDSSPTNGMLEAGSTTNVMLSLNPSSSSLPIGIYQETILFSNLTHGTKQSRSAALEIIPEPLRIGPTDDWSPTGYEGGPFTPATALYTLSNNAAINLEWSIFETSDWLTAAPTNGVLLPTSTTNIMISLNDSITNQMAGSYPAQIIFSNLTFSTGQSRAATLDIFSEPLGIDPPGNWESTGYVGGPFAPTNMLYALTNGALTNLEWAVTETAAWLNAVPTNGILGAGATTNITFILNTIATNLPIGTYEETILFSNLTAGTGQSREATLEVAPKPLGIAPIENWEVAGYEGGEFTPSTMQYTLTNNATTNIQWSLSKTSDWLDTTPSNGTLLVGATTNVTLSLNSFATGLQAGIYPGQVLFTNLTHGTVQHRSTTLNILPEPLGINPVTEWIPTGYEGGPYSPSEMIYTLTNNVISNTEWAVSETAEWFDASATNGTLEAGGSSNVTFSVNGSATNLPAGTYPGQILFSNLTHGTEQTRIVTLEVLPESLGITPTDTWSPSGYIGGPFSPAIKLYALTNSSATNLEWTVIETAQWINAAPSNGVLAVGTTTNVLLSLDAVSSNLTSGTYVETVLFSNVTTATLQTRTATLEILPEPLGINPINDWTPSGYEGGSFTPTAMQYSLTNSALTNLEWSVSANSTWFDTMPTNGILETGAITNVMLSVNGAISNLTAGTYAESVLFSNVTLGTEQIRTATLEVWPEPLGINPILEWFSTGYEGGPFTPGTETYVITNSATTNLEWSVSVSATWLDSIPTNGILEAGASSNMTISINGSATNLLPGYYTAEISYSNSTAGTRQVRSASLEVFPEPLSISPTNDWNSTGYEGGPFTPGTMLYTLTNSALTNLEWAVIETAAWFDLILTNGILAPGSTTNLMLSINPSASNLITGIYTEQIFFTNMTAGTMQTRSASLEILQESLGITPIDEWTPVIYEDAPFSPSSMVYMLTNSSPANLQWSLSGATNWLSAVPTNGTIEAGAFTNIEISINATISNLTAGVYPEIVLFSNITHGTELNRYITLTVLPEALIVEPPDEWNPAGYEGGLIAPASKIYTLSNNASSHMEWQVSETALWLNATPTNGMLAAGAGTNITLSLTGTLTNLSAGLYQEQVLFSNITSGTRQSRSVVLDVYPEPLVIEPVNNWEASGYAGGPFAPDSMVYILTNSTSTNLEWAVNQTSSWFDVSPTNGILDPGSTTNLTFSINQSASNLTTGIYSEQILFTNVTAGTLQTRAATLEVLPDPLGITPDANWDPTGYEHGNFAPASIQYTLTNSAISNIEWRVSENAIWFDIAPTNGILEAGTITNVVLSINETASNLTAGTYAESVLFSNVTLGTEQIRTATLEIWSEPLGITPVLEWSSTGYEGGPFTPGTETYVITNSATTNLDWSVSLSEAWLDALPTNGILEAGASTNLTISINGSATNLLTGYYTAHISFSNTTVGTLQVRSASLEVFPEPLGITPIYDWNSSGYEGGPFSPTIKLYTLTNSSVSNLEWTVIESAQWINATPSNGVLGAGTTTNVVLSLDAVSSNLTFGTYVETVLFSNVTTATLQTRSAILEILPEPLNIDPINDWTPSGYEGGAFTPSAMQYSLTNSGLINLEWSIREDSTWFKAAPTNGILGAGAITNMVLSINETASNLTAGTYAESVLFSNVTLGTEQIRTATLEVWPEPLGITPVLEWSSTGYEGGPFTPGTETYVITNSATTNLEWSVSVSEAWLDALPTNGLLEAGGSSNITISINGSATNLLTGYYTVDISFSNTIAGTLQVRSASLEVFPEPLSISPTNEWNSSGYEGGPFAPETMLYTLTNSALTNLEWAVSVTASWLDATATNGILEAGTTTNLMLSITPSASNLTTGVYTEQIFFSNLTAGTLQARSATLEIHSAPLGITPNEDWNPIGYEGGNFSPPAIQYTLTNSATSNLEWSVSHNSTWFDATPTNGVLEAGTTTNVVMSIHAAVSNYTAGIYTEFALFSNLTHSTELIRTATLEVLPEPLGIAPTDNWTSSGYEGGPFTPSATIYTLTNNATPNLEWSVKASATWLVASPTNGSLVAGATTNITISLSETATTLPSDRYSALILFSNLTANTAQTRSATLEVLSESLKIDPLTDWNPTGYAGGPFSPASQLYTLTNNSVTNLTWNTIETSPWFDAAPTNGTLSPGATTNIILSITSAATNQLVGIYEDQISFSNLTANTQQSRTATLHILPEPLGIDPMNDWTSSGYEGGLFTPTATQYTLTNSAQTNLEWRVSESSTWFDAMPTNGILESGAITNVVLTITETASNQTTGTYPESILFSNLTLGTEQIRAATLEVLPAALGIDPVVEWAPSGYEGGPFSPNAIIYALTNSTETSIDWSISETAPWFDPVPTNGQLAAGASTNVTVSIHPSTASLAAGVYPEQILFSNITHNSAQSRSAALEILPESLGIEPITDWETAGYEGGPFMPDTVIYTLTNSALTNLSWSVTGSTFWFDLSSSNGTLEAGSTTNITLSLNSSATNLTPGLYEEYILFSNQTYGTEQTRSVSLEILPEPLNVSPSEEWLPSGHEKGPFSPDSTVYHLSNSAPVNIEWSVRKNEDWLDITPTNGTLQAGATTNITLLVNDSATNLLVGTYPETILFSNVTHATEQSRSILLEIFSEPLGIEPDHEWIPSGYEGGPFAPASMLYTLTNNSLTNLEWTVSETAPWFDALPTNGMLMAGATTNVTLSIHPSTSGLAAGTYPEEILFINETATRVQVLEATLEIIPEPLGIDPADEWNAIGYEGGPFTPGAIVYALTNNAVSNLEWSVTSTALWFDIAPSNGILATGESTNITLSISGAASNLLAGIYADPTIFSNLTAGTQQSRDATLEILPEPLVILPAENWSSSGYEGGPFSPTSTMYALTNSASTNIEWSVSEASFWFDAMPTNGILAAHATTNITLTISETATNLNVGTYPEQILFSNRTFATEQTRSATLDVLPDPLTITPAYDWNPMGFEGGPFTPDTTVYSLTNNSLTNLEWSVSGAAPWFDTVPTSGILAAEAATNIVLSINGTATNLSVGSYIESMIFSNLTRGTEYIRTATLEILPEPLYISPTNEWISSGYEGGPFAPTSMVYTLTNGTLISLDWSVSETAGWLEATPATGALAVGETTNVTLSLLPAASSLTAGTYIESILFSNLTFATEQVRSATLEVEGLDLDNDGIPDAWEVVYFGDPANCIATNDADMDGHNNLQEYITGMDPTNAMSVFIITSYTWMMNDSLIEWPAVTGRVYSALWSTNLTDGFHTLKARMEYPQNSATDTVHGTENQSFYKVEVRLK